MTHMFLHLKMKKKELLKLLEVLIIMKLLNLGVGVKASKWLMNYFISNILYSTIASVLGIFLLPKGL